MNEFFLMKTATQLALFLANKPGTLATVCDALARAGINILALTVSDASDHAVVRMVVSDPVRARDLFEEHNALCIETEILLCEAENQPGQLSGIARALAGVGVNIEYAYLATGVDSAKGLLVLRPSDLPKALETLRDVA